MRLEDGHFRFDLDGIDRALADGAGTLIVCQPYNPLGRCFTAEELRAVATLVDRHGARVVSDEIHAPLTYGNVHVPYVTASPEAASHAVTLTSASKAWNLPGLKCAAAITSNDADEARWQQISEMRTHGASTIGIEANLAAFRRGGPWLDETVAYLDGNRQLLGRLLAEHLPDVRYRLPEATYLAWLDFTDFDLPVPPAQLFLDKARVAMNPGIAFGRQAKACTRFNFGTTAAIIEQAVTCMAGAVASL